MEILGFILFVAIVGGAAYWAYKNKKGPFKD
jgi:hypothetical protein